MQVGTSYLFLALILEGTTNPSGSNSHPTNDIGSRGGTSGTASSADTSSTRSSSSGGSNGNNSGSGNTSSSSSSSTANIIFYNPSSTGATISSGSSSSGRSKVSNPPWSSSSLPGSWLGLTVTREGALAAQAWLCGRQRQSSRGRRSPQPLFSAAAKLAFEKALEVNSHFEAWSLGSCKAGV